MQERDVVRTYNRDYLDNIAEIYVSGDIKRARKYLEEYRLEYTDNHYLFKVYDALISCSEGNIDNAIAIFEEVVYSNRYDVKDIELYHFACLLVERKRYQEAYDVLDKIDIKYLINNTKVTYKNFVRLLSFLKKELHIDFDVLQSEHYSTRQLYDYSYERAKHHIYKKHNVSYEDSYGFYMDSDSFNNLYDLVNNALVLAEKTFEFFSGDAYYFKVPDVGVNYYNSGVTNILKVWTNFHRKEILTMFPIEEVKNNCWIINEIKIENDEYFSKKVRKRVSQIDKFNKKYNL